MDRLDTDTAGGLREVLDAINALGGPSPGAGRGAGAA
jgi:hypothetical protein